MWTLKSDETSNGILEHRSTQTEQREHALFSWSSYFRTYTCWTSSRRLVLIRNDFIWFHIIDSFRARCISRGTHRAFTSWALLISTRLSDGGTNEPMRAFPCSLRKSLHGRDPCYASFSLTLLKCFTCRNFQQPAIEKHRHHQNIDCVLRLISREFTRFQSGRSKCGRICTKYFKSLFERLRADRSVKFALLSGILNCSSF